MELKRPRLFVELCCGSAAVTLALIGGLGCKPPISYMGSKTAFVRIILRLLGLSPGQGADAVLLADLGEWARTWSVLLNPELCRKVAEIVKTWIPCPDCAGRFGEVHACRACGGIGRRDPRALWEELAAKGPPKDSLDRSARWLCLQGGSALSLPVEEVDGVWRTRGYGHVSQSAKDRGFVERLRPDLLAQVLTELPFAAKSVEATADHLWLQGYAWNSTPISWDGEQLKMGHGGGGVCDAQPRHDSSSGIQSPAPIADRVERIEEMVADWLLVQGRQRQNVPVWAGEEGWRTDDHATGRSTTPWQQGEGRGMTPEGMVDRLERVEEVADWLWVQARALHCAPVFAEAGEWQMNHPRCGNKSVVQRGASEANGRGLTADGFQERVDRLIGQQMPTVAVYRGRAEELVPPRDASGVVGFLDPPYVEKTGYGYDMPREVVLDTARAWDAAGATFGISEAVPLADDLGDGWWSVEITNEREGPGRTKGREFFTANVPMELLDSQLGLFAESGCVRPA